MKKQSGFTLIELMVVMAIIAILATAGLSAYSGYIRKARDTTRIADISAINNIVLASLSGTGKPPQTTAAVHSLIVAMNNGQGIFDPLGSQTDGSNLKSVCKQPSGTTGGTPFICGYTYRLCDGGMGYAVGARFESESNIGLYLSDDISSAGSSITFPDANIYELGSCAAYCTSAISGCSIASYNVDSTPTLIDANGNLNQEIGL